jgi:hypothetical protein
VRFESADAATFLMNSSNDTPTPDKADSDKPVDPSAIDAHQFFLYFASSTKCWTLQYGPGFIAEFPNYRNEVNHETAKKWAEYVLTCMKHCAMFGFSESIRRPPQSLLTDHPSFKLHESSSVPAVEVLPPPASFADLAASPRSWPQDFDYENGNYSCRCRYCKNYFVGHKRRCVCRVCGTSAEKLQR